MGKWGVWTASALAAAGAGAGLAVLRRRRPAAAPIAPGAARDPVPPPAAEGPPAEDPQAALDAARERLRARADRLREEIEGREGTA